MRFTEYRWCAFCRVALGGVKRMDLGVIEVLVLLGVVSGFAAGIGGGGAPFAVALLILVLPALGVASGPEVGRIAGATSVALIVPTNIGALTAHLARGAVDFRMLAVFGPSLFLGTVLAAVFAPKIDPLFLAVAFTGFAVYTAWRLFAQRRPQGTQSGKPPRAAPLATRGLLGGAIATLLGTGIGFVAIPAMARFIPMPRAVGTNAALALPLALAGTATYLMAPNGCAGCVGYVYLPALAAMGLSAVLTVPVGVWAAQQVPDLAVRAFFALALFLAAGNLLYRTADAAVFARHAIGMAQAIPNPFLDRDTLPVAGAVPAWLQTEGR